MNRKAVFGMGVGGGGMRSISIIFAFVLIIAGIVPLLHDLGVISFYFQNIPQMIINIILFIGGLLLLVDSFNLM